MPSKHPLVSGKISELMTFNTESWYHVWWIPSMQRSHEGDKNWANLCFVLFDPSLYLRSLPLGV